MVRLPSQVVSRLKILSRKEGSTLFMTLLAAFKALIHCDSGQSKIVVGTPIATRNRLEVQGLIGNFVNFLPVLTDLSGDPSFVAVLRRVRGALLESYADPELPFEVLAQALDPDCDRDYRPALCQVLFGWHGPTPPPRSFGGLNARLLHSGNLTRSCKKDLHIHVAEYDDAISIETEYNTDLFERETIDRFLDRYRLLVEALVLHPSHPVARLAAADNDAAS
jgi:non-ribosomal peptide synthetase component F